MQLPQHIAEAILSAENKALATEGAHGINVVPVSTLRIVDGKIWLMNYFLGKTLENILMRPHVALACWKGLEGYQIKGAVQLFRVVIDVGHALVGVDILPVDKSAVSFRELKLLVG